MNTLARTFPAVHWPAPPFFGSPSRGRRHSAECALEFIDGRVTRGELVDFEPGMNSIGLRLTEPQGLKWIDLASLRSIKLMRPVSYVPKRWRWMPSKQPASRRP